MVQRGVGREGWGVVDLQQDGVALAVQHDVQPQYVETHTPGVVLRLRTPVLVRHQRQSAYDCLYRHVFDLLLEEVDVQPLRCQLLKHRSEGTFVPHPHVFGV